jgi:hypothetical protein
LYHRSLAMFRELNQPSNEYATMLNDYAVFVQDQEKYSLADSLFRSAIEMYKSLPTDNRKQLASSLHNLALNYDWLGQFSSADSLYRESLLIQRDAYGGVNVQMASTIGNMGFIAEGQGKFDDAERLYRESLSIRLSLLDENHHLVIGNKIKLGLFLLDHSSVVEESERLCREALTSLQKTNPELKRLIARAHLGIGRALLQKGVLTTAERELREAIANFNLAQPINEKNLAEGETFLAQNLTAQNKFSEAETHLLHAQQRLSRTEAQSSDEMRRTTATLAALYKVWKQK